MEMIVLSIHLLVCICLIGLVLLQRSEGGALGMGGGGGGALMSGRGAADALAKMTSVAGGFFLVTSLSLTVLSGASASTSGHSVFDRLRAPASAPATTPVAPAPAATTPVEPAPPATQPADPTEGSITPSTQLASITPGPSQAAAATLPAAQRPNQAAAHAAPLTPTSGATTTAPARSQPTALNTTTRPPATQRTGTATTQNRQLVLPNTSGAVTGITLEDTQSEPESVDVGNGLEAVRRQTRAGPDQ